MQKWSTYCKGQEVHTLTPPQRALDEVDRVELRETLRLRGVLADRYSSNASWRAEVRRHAEVANARYEEGDLLAYSVRIRRLSQLGAISDRRLDRDPRRSEIAPS